MSTTEIAILAAVAGPLAALVGGLVTFFAGWLSDRRRFVAEIQKMRHDVLRMYAEKLIEARMGAYPQLYPILSNAGKHLDFPDAFNKQINIADLESAVNIWDSQHGVLLTVESGRRAMELRTQIRAIARSNVWDTPESDESKKLWSDLRDSLAAFEVALRGDLGVYAVEFGNPERGFRSYGTVCESDAYSRTRNGLSIRQWINSLAHVGTKRDETGS